MNTLIQMIMDILWSFCSRDETSQLRLTRGAWCAQSLDDIRDFNLPRLSAGRYLVASRTATVGGVAATTKF